MRFYLLRHGQTAYNAAKKYQGVRDIPLSPEGEAELCAADVSPEIVYVSPLSRARQTAERMFPTARKIAIPALMEMNFGVFEGKNHIEMEHDAEYRAWVDGNCEGRCPGGESKQEFSDRTCKAFSELMERTIQSGADCLVIVAHGGTQMAVLERYGLPKKSFYEWIGPTAGGHVLETTPERWKTEQTLTWIKTVQYIRKGGAE